MPALVHGGGKRGPRPAGQVPRCAPVQRPGTSVPAVEDLVGVLAHCDRAGSVKAASGS